MIGLEVALEGAEKDCKFPVLRGAAGHEAEAVTDSSLLAAASFLDHAGGKPPGCLYESGIIQEDEGLEGSVGAFAATVADLAGGAVEDL